MTLGRLHRIFDVGDAGHQRAVGGLVGYRDEAVAEQAEPCSVRSVGTQPTARQSRCPAARRTLCCSASATARQSHDPRGEAHAALAVAEGDSVGTAVHLSQTPGLTSEDRAQFAHGDRLLDALPGRPSGRRSWVWISVCQDARDKNFRGAVSLRADVAKCSLTVENFPADE